MTWATTFDPQQKAKERAKRIARQRPAKTLHSSTMTGGTRAALPKGETARPGKRAPTVAEREWMDAIVAYGCVACRIDGNGFRPAAVHHILRAGVRMGHLFTLPLCDPGHHQNGGQHYPSRHPWKARFEAKYGTEAELLERLRNEIGAMA